MNKRKIDINQIKKAVLRGKKQKFVSTKYQVALSFFKQKDHKNQHIFAIYFETLIQDFLQQLNNTQFVYKCQNDSKEDLKLLEITDQGLKLEGTYLKSLFKQYPIHQIVDCLSIKRDLSTKRIRLQINKNKQMFFFKHLRKIYPQFCFCVGEKVIIQNYDIKNLYESFKSEWTKLYERGRMAISQKLQTLLCRSLYFIAVLIENNIFQEIEEQQRKKKQESADLGTKSQKKRNVRGITHQVSSTYSFGSNDMLSNFSYGLKSQKSNEQDFYKTGFSQKSEKIIRKQRCQLWDKVQVQNLKIKMPVEHPGNGGNQQNRFEVDLLSNDVENILIEQAFKIQKLNDCGRNRYQMQPQYPYDYSVHYYGPQYYQNFHNYHNYQNSYVQPHSFVSEQPDLFSLRRSFNFTNLVQTRKTHSRMGGNKYS